MSSVSLVGIGADGWDGLTGTARAAIAGSDVLFGAQRQLELIPAEASCASRVCWPSPMMPAVAGLLEQYGDDRRCVLASGDPMFYGIGASLMQLLGRANLVVIAQPSSVSLACARLGWAVEATQVISGVGRPLDNVVRYLAAGRRLLVLSADDQSPAKVAALLTERGYGPSELTVLESLGSAAERLVSGSAQDWHEPVAKLNIMAIRCELEQGRYPVAGICGLPDEAFEHDGQLTKRDVRAVTLARLAPEYGQLLWDVGSGSGSIAIEWMRSAERGSAVAIERDQGRTGRISRNAHQLGVPELTVLHGSAPDAFHGLATPDAIFVGGGLTTQGVFDACWRALRPGGRLVANAVTLETEALLLKHFQALGGELIRLGVSVAAPVGGFTGWRPAMPVTMWSVLKP